MTSQHITCEKAACLGSLGATVAQGKLRYPDAVGSIWSWVAVASPLAPGRLAPDRQSCVDPKLYPPELTGGQSFSEYDRHV